MQQQIAVLKLFLSSRARFLAPAGPQAFSWPPQAAWVPAAATGAPQPPQVSIWCGSAAAAVWRQASDHIDCCCCCAV